MPAALMPKTEVLDRLTTVFREYGYDGASIARLSAATGLGKASLYHYFKGGKEEMAGAVLAHVGSRFSALVIAPLKQHAGPEQRVRAMTDGLNEFYNQGGASCTLDLFGFGSAGELFQPQLKGSIHRFRNALAEVIQAAGLEHAEAETRAEDAIVAIQGALVLGRATGEKSVFQRVLRGLPDRLLRPA